MDIEELRAKCITLGFTWAQDQSGHHAWYAREAVSNVVVQMARKDEWLGRETERELLEDLLIYVGVYNEHTVHGA